jgi:hypothetical protein
LAGAANVFAENPNVSFAKFLLFATAFRVYRFATRSEWRISMTRSPVARGLLAKFSAARQEYRADVAWQLYTAEIGGRQNGALRR